MHFVGMLAYTLPIPLGYLAAMTFVSWRAIASNKSLTAISRHMPRPIL